MVLEVLYLLFEVGEGIFRLDSVGSRREESQETLDIELVGQTVLLLLVLDLSQTLGQVIALLFHLLLAPSDRLFLLHLTQDILLFLRSMTLFGRISCFPA